MWLIALVRAKSTVGLGCKLSFNGKPDAGSKPASPQ